MIDISERAQQHFLRLLSQQGIDGLGIRLRVTSPGTPAANCELEFCEPVDLAGGEWTIECTGFEFHVDGDSASWLDQASIDFEPNATGGPISSTSPPTTVTNGSHLTEVLVPAVSKITASVAVAASERATFAPAESPAASCPSDASPMSSPTEKVSI